MMLSSHLHPFYFHMGVQVSFGVVSRVRVTRVSHSRAGAFRLAVSLQTKVSLSFLPLLCFQPLT